MRRCTTELFALAGVLGACLALGPACGDDDDEPPRQQTGPEEPRGEPEPQAAEEPPADPVPEPRAQLVLGAAHGCLLSAEGTVRCWGSQRFGQLGGTPPAPGPEASSADPVAVTGLEDAVRIAAGSFHTCAIRRGGGVACWGHGGFGQLGADDHADHVTPVAVALDEPAVEIAAGEGHTCARLSSRHVACWGRNTFGQLGVDTPAMRPSPRVVRGVDDAVGLALGRDFSCALIEGGEVRCWGAGLEGQLGDGERAERRAEPRAVLGLPAARAVVAGSAHACAILEDGGTVRCWGRDDSGQVGDGEGGDPDDVTPSPAAVAGLDDVQALAAGARHTCALGANGSVSCWGYNGFGQLGDGTEDARPSPTPVPGLAGVVELAAGARGTCARLGSGEVRCWGRNHLGQLGAPAGDPHPSPTPCCGTRQGS